MRGRDDTWTSTLKSAALALLRRIHARCRTWPALRANGAGQQSPTSTRKSSPHMEQGQYLGAGTMSPQADDAHLHKERGTTRAGTVATTTSPSIPTAAMQIPMRHPTRALSPLLPSISILVSPAQPRTQSFTTTVWCRAGQSPAANKKAIAIAGGGTLLPVRDDALPEPHNRPAAARLDKEGVVVYGRFSSGFGEVSSTTSKVSSLTFVFDAGEKVVVLATWRPLPVGTMERQPLTTTSPLRVGTTVCGHS